MRAGLTQIRFASASRRPEKIGVAEVFGQFLSWDLPVYFQLGISESIKYVIFGTNLKFYISQGTSFNDVTPIRSTTAAGDVTFVATNGSSTITVTDTAHVGPLLMTLSASLAARPAWVAM